MTDPDVCVNMAALIIEARLSVPGMRGLYIDSIVSGDYRWKINIFENDHDKWGFGNSVREAFDAALELAMKND